MLTQCGAQTQNPKVKSQKAPRIEPTVPGTRLLLMRLGTPRIISPVPMPSPEIPHYESVWDIYV